MIVLAVDNKKLEGAVEKFLVETEGGNVWQSQKWGEFQEGVGRRVFRVAAFETGRREEVGLPGEVVAMAQVVENVLPMGKKWWYVQRGPVWKDVEGCKKILSELKKRAKDKGVIFILVDPEKNLPEDLVAYKSNSVQPRETLVVNLQKEEEEILAQMKQKGRYNIRLAKKRGVKIKKGKGVKNFYGLLKETTERDGFRGWGEKYYKKMVKGLGKAAVVLEAWYEGEVVAAGIFVFWKKRAIYYYGASGNKHRRVMAPYLMQWEAMCEAKRRGCEEYDFLGVAPEGEKGHVWAGVTRFKEKFGGKRKKFPQAKKIVVSRFWNFLYVLVKRVKR